MYDFDNFYIQKLGHHVWGRKSFESRTGVEGIENCIGQVNFDWTIIYFGFTKQVFEFNSLG